ncbi:cytoplasmic protein [Spiractinospora alimapuensis]|uniref:glutamine amidotransferase n=1 Tax=Spiractinospora alimapuensis TaxID=2820884 RepID=UPI001F25E6E1|nr:glutamine amidotransferase [Spiractinospora alimapuensis]QVQ51772.1 cytoplasmic protein [Spiractinospora alimapuensis]
MSRVLIAGESWVTVTTHIKGVDSFSTHSYTEGVGPLRDALRAAGHEVTHLPAHLVPQEFPDDAAALSAYDVVVLSDIGANSIQLAPNVFDRSERGHDRLANLAGWVHDGGALLMVGGYLSFTGFEAKGAFRQSPIAPVLPVEMLAEDDRVELPAGADPAVLDAQHPATAGAGSRWPHLLGYNRVIARPESTTLAEINGDPLVTVASHGQGRTAVFTSDCSPHWAPPEFCENWDGYQALFDGLIRWLAD